MVKLNSNNLFELKNFYRTETAHYVYTVEPYRIGTYRLLRREKLTPENAIIEDVKMPEIYRGYFKEWRWWN